jgi:hypothetical protein
MAERASLDELRKFLGAQSTKDDAVLGMVLESAGSWVYDRVYPESIQKPEVVQAVLILAARLYKRRQSPEGVAGWDDMGAIRIIATDPDVRSLLEQHIDSAKVLGIG